jgi:hemolysin D
LSRDNPHIATVRQFQSETDAIREAPEPLALRMTVLLLVGLFVSLVGLTFVTRMDRVVSSTAGKVVPTQAVNVYQALDPSIIKSINVREGELVEPGQLLATLDPTFAAADVKQLNRQVASLEAQIARAEAELARKPLVYADTSDPDRIEYQNLQKALHDQMTLNYRSQIDSFDSKIKTTQATIAKYETDSARYGQREQIAKQIEDIRLELEAKGAGSLLNRLTTQDQRLEMLRFQQFGYNSLTEARETLSSTKSDREAFVQKWLTDISQELVKARGDLGSASAQLEKAQKKQDLVRLTAAERSVVLTVAKLSVGSVLKEGDTLFTLMPANAPLESEIHIAARDVAFVRPGDRCVSKIDAFNFAEHGTAEGAVRWISEGAFTTDDNGQPLPGATAEAYYKARCTIDPAGLINVPDGFRLIPGMTLTGDVEVGTRSVAFYLLGGFIKGVREAMREPR